MLCQVEAIPAAEFGRWVGDREDAGNGSVVSDGDGMIQKNEARQFFMAMKYFEEEMGAGLHEEDFIEGFDEMDTDGDDLVDEEEFFNP